MVKILEIKNPKVLEKEKPDTWDTVDYIVQYENGGTQLITKSIYEFKFLLFKNKKYLGKLGNLVLICEILWLLFGE